MASAFLHSRNEPRSSDLTKFTNNTKLNFTRLHNITTPNPNPSPNPSHYFIGNTNRDFVWKNREQRPSAAFNTSHGYRYITFRLSSYTRRELKELKKRLISDLERVRALKHWVCSTPVAKRSYHPPPLALPPPPLPPEAASKGNERQKSAVGQKRTKPPAPAIRDTKKQCGRVKNNNVQKSKLVVMRKCGQILAKLMKHKHGWVFNSPVDAAALKLYDYHSVISNPMDLGTIKSKLAKNEYESPMAFASDVRLTFQNAMVYNGKDSGVFVMAERLLLLFEDLFNQKTMGIQAKKPNRAPKVPVRLEMPISNQVVPPQMAVIRKPAFLVNPNPNPNLNPNINIDRKAMTRMGRGEKKRVMTAEEKSELAGSLLNFQLEAEGMDEMMGIIKKGGLGLGVGVEHTGDEVELDLGVLDDETLWELHSFISSSKKNTNLVSCVQANNCAGSKAVMVVEEEGRKRERARERDGGGEEDIDIGEEEMGVSNFPFVEIEKDGVNGGGGGTSSSSSSDSSSSSSSSSSSGNGV